MPTKILWVSNIGYNCSYNIVSKSFIGQLVNNHDYEVYLFCVGKLYLHEEDPVGRISQEYNVDRQKVFILKILTINKSIPEDLTYAHNYVFGVYSLDEAINMIKPDVTILLNDTGPTRRQIKMSKNLTNVFPYIAIDHLYQKQEFFDYKIDNLITMNQFSKDQIAAYLPNTTIHTLPLMSDGTTYYPLTNKVQLQKKWLKKDYSDAFVVFCHNANHVRKRWDLTLEAFCKFAQKHDNSILVIKTPSLIGEEYDKDAIIPNWTYNLLDLIKVFTQKYGISPDRIIKFEGQISSEDLNELYNCMDIGISTTSGEGWGLTPCEMALTKLPVIIPKSTSFPEIFENSAGLIDVEPYPQVVGRYRSSYDKNTIFDPIIKSLPNHKDSFETKSNLSISKDYDTICISPNGIDKVLNKYESGFTGMDLNIIGHFKTVHFASEFYKNTISHSNKRLQILLNYNYDLIMKERDLLYDLENTFPAYPMRNHLQINDELIKSITTYEFGGVEIPTVDAIIEKLELFYNDPELREKEANYVYELISRKYSPEAVMQKFYKIISQPSEEQHSD